MNNTEPINVHPKKRYLIVGLTRDLRIVQFDKECQKITGYTRDEILKSNQSDKLIPARFIKEWHEQINNINIHSSIQKVEIPWKTKSGKEVIIQWDGFLLNRKHADQLYCLIGTTVLPSIGHDDIMDHAIEKQNIPRDLYPIPIPSERNEEVVETTRVLLLPPHKNIDCNASNAEVDTFNKTTNHTMTIQKNGIFKKTTQESDTMKKIVDDLSKKYEILHNKFKDLDKKNRELERKNKLLEKNLNTFKNTKPTSVQEQQSDMIEHRKHKEAKYGKTIVANIRDPFGFKRKKQDIESKLQLLNDQKKELLAKEAELLRERKELDQKIAEMSSWKEKLIRVEEEIENRRNALLEQESLLQQKINITAEHSKLESNTDLTKTNTTELQDDLLSSIPECAAVIQRGILKQVNTLFSDLIGFSAEELINRSLFDFIAPEGLSEVEHYYLNRLKGNDISNYSTVFFTKNNEKISAQVHLQPTVFRGEKAEITVIKQIKKEIQSQENKEK